MTLTGTARVAVSAAPGGGVRYDELRSAPPVALRPTRAGLSLVGTAASPVGADRTRLEVDVGPAACLSVTSVAATVAWRSAGSRASVVARVGDGATLTWRPEPLVATAGCDHVVDARVHLAPTATLDWEERLVLGRTGEGPGRLATHLRVDVDGRPLLRHSLAVGDGAPGWQGPASCGAHRAVGLVVLAGPGVAAATSAGDVGTGRWAVAPLDGPGVVLLAVADGALGLDAALAAARLAT